MENAPQQNIPVVILCGGQGTRLKEETEYIPKPLVKVGEHPIIWHVMKLCHAQGFRKFVLLTGYKGDKIKEYFYYYPIRRSDFTLHLGKEDSKITFHNRPEERWEVTLLDTGLTTQTGGRLKKAEHFLGGSKFILTYTDGVADINLGELLKLHGQEGKIVTMSVVSPPGRFGEVEIDGKLAKSFQEKPHSRSQLINAGFFVVEPNIFEYLDTRPELNFEKEVLPRLAQSSELVVYPHRGFWQCMDTLRDAELLNEIWSKGEAPWKIWES